jgi:hypothetical protein
MAHLHDMLRIYSDLHLHCRAAQPILRNMTRNQTRRTRAALAAADSLIGADAVSIIPRSVAQKPEAPIPDPVVSA